MTRSRHQYIPQLTRARTQAKLLHASQPCLLSFWYLIRIFRYWNSFSLCVRDAKATQRCMQQSTAVAVGWKDPKRYYKSCECQQKHNKCTVYRLYKRRRLIDTSALKLADQRLWRLVKIVLRGCRAFATILELHTELEKDTNDTEFKISWGTVLWRLSSFDNKPRRVAVGMPLTRNQHVCKVLFVEDSSITLYRSDGHQRVFQRRGECSTDNCMVKCDRFDCGRLSAIVWRGICSGRKTRLTIIDDDLIAQRYIDIVLHFVVVPFVR